MVKFKPKLIASLVTFSIILLLIFAGPVEAFILGLQASETTILQGNSFSFIASAQIESGETKDISHFIIDLDGPISISCAFFPNGTKISSCNGMTIEQIESTTYGYGYGYGFLQGNLSYNITIDTTNYPEGKYMSELIAISPTIYSFRGPDIMVTKQPPLLEKCSVRADDGDAIVLGDDFGEDNKINFYLPRHNAVKGSGNLMMNKGRQRFSYKFKILEVLSFQNNIAEILVNGEYKVHRGQKISDSAIITLDLRDDLVSIDSTDFSVSDMQIDFLKGCQG